MNKAQHIKELNRYMLAKTLSMFEYSGLPDTIPAKELERLLQTNGFAFISEVDGNLYALSGGLGGERDAYQNPTTINVANPALNVSQTFNLESDGVLIGNDDEMMGIMPLMRYYHGLLTENNISMNLASFNARVTTFLSASDDKTRESAERFIKRIKDGELTVIGDNAMFDGVKSHSGSSASNARITDLIEYQQFLKSTLYGELGINAPFNMKRERLNSSEVGQHESSLTLFVDDMKRCRVEAIEKINEKYGTEITCKFSGVWAREEKKQDSQATIEGEANDKDDNGTIETANEAADEAADEAVNGTDSATNETDSETGEQEMIEESQQTTISEYLDGADLWGAIKAVENFPFIDDKLNKMFITMYGRSPLFSEIESNTVDELATMIVMLYGGKWQDLIESTGAEFGAVETKRTTETVASDESGTHGENATQKVSAYNDPEMVDDTGSETTGTDTKAGTVDRETIESKFTNDSTYQSLQMADKLTIIRVAMSDVAEFMKLSVY